MREASVKYPSEGWTQNMPINRLIACIAPQMRRGGSDDD